MAGESYPTMFTIFAAVALVMAVAMFLLSTRGVRHAPA